MLYAITDTLLKVLLNTNKTGHHFYVITDTLLKVSLSTNKIGHHVVRYTWHIVESLDKHQ
jgi:hypothetical protein